jgi:hypothetical protein
MLLTWHNQRSEGTLATQSSNIHKFKTRPELTFPFTDIFYDTFVGTSFKIADGKEVALLDDEVSEVRWAIEYFTPPERYVLSVDANGVYQGMVLESVAFKVVKMEPPNGDNWLYNFTTEQYEYISAVNDDGVYIGNAAFGSYSVTVPTPPPSPNSVWDFGSDEWIDGRGLDVLKRAAKDCVNEERAYLIDLPLPFLGTKFQTNKASRDKLRDTLLSFQMIEPLPIPYHWRDAADNLISVTEGDLTTLFKMIRQRVEDVYQASWVEKEAIEAMTTRDPLFDYNWNTSAELRLGYAGKNEFKGNKDALVKT